jgi:plastocyanin
MTADEREHETEHAPESDGASLGRRRLLASAGAVVSTALASAGCLTNPWGPASPGATESSSSPGDEADGVATGTTTATRSEASTDSTGSTTADGTGDDPGTAEPTAEPRDGTTEPRDGTTEPRDATEAPTGVSAADRDPDLVVAVAPDGFEFEPSSFTVDAGDVVRWEWRASGHNVQVRSKPDRSDWTGTGPASETFAEGHVHAHVFETPGEYAFFCAPHQSLGMTGSFTVR